MKVKIFGRELGASVSDWELSEVGFWVFAITTLLIAVGVDATVDTHPSWWNRFHFILGSCIGIYLGRHLPLWKRKEDQ